MKITIEFNLPEEEGQFKEAINSGKAFTFIYEFEQYLRGVCKYYSEEDGNVNAETIRNMFYKMKGECFNEEL